MIRNPRHVSLEQEGVWIIAVQKGLVRRPALFKSNGVLPEMLVLNFGSLY